VTAAKKPKPKALKLADVTFVDAGGRVCKRICKAEELD
jgi:hypothetical protein